WLIYFLFSIDNGNHLYSVLAKENFEHSFIPLSFYGAFHGYTGLGNELTNILYSNKTTNTDTLNLYSLQEGSYDNLKVPLWSDESNKMDNDNSEANLVIPSEIIKHKEDNESSDNVQS